MSDPKKRIHCAKHGETAAAFVCTHIFSGVGCGFHADDEGDDEWPDAWCDLCQRTLDRDGDWNDDNNPDIRILCTGCYETSRSRNQAVPAPLTARDVEVRGEALDAFFHAVCERCKVRQAATNRRWSFIGRKKWLYDAEASTMRFYDDVRDAGVIANATPVGSFSTNTHSWLWVWANEGYPAEVRARVERFRVFGEVRGIERCALSGFEGTEVDAWELAQVAADLEGAEAVYRAPFDHLYVFFLLDGFRHGQ